MSRLKKIALEQGAELPSSLVSQTIDYICANCVFETPEREDYPNEQRVHYLCRASIPKEDVFDKFPELRQYDEQNVELALGQASDNYKSYPELVDVVNELKKDADDFLKLKDTTLESDVTIQAFQDEFVIDCSIEPAEQAAQ